MAEPRPSTAPGPTPATRAADPRIGRRRVLAATALAFAYPLMSHLAIWRQSGILALAAVLVLLLLLLGPGLIERRPRTWSILAGAIAALAGVAIATPPAAATAILYLPPVALYLTVSWLFARTLMPGRRALLQTLVWHLHGRPARMDPEIARYTHRLTGLWAALLFAIALGNLLLAMLVSPGGLLERVGLESPWPVAPATWSAMAHAGGLVLVLLLLVSEYAWRWHRLPQERERFASLGAFLRHLREQLPGLWRDLAR